MKKIFMSLPIAAILIASCDDNTKQSTNVDKSISDSVTEHCYTYILNKDSVFMHIKMANDSVTGDLIYNYFEKDKNTGIIHGKMKGDTLVADYKFFSEGSESIREIAFLKKGNDFEEGYGDMQDVNSKMIFKNTGTLNFKSNIVLRSVECNK
ncbi:MAG TPA: hypothetical protein VGP43_04930 [Chitinophagaceae bacterium]|nr:hypothetical protein [Chitinophagaceae bacterium]